MGAELSIARRVLAQCRALGKISEEPGALTRTFLSEAMRSANAMAGKVMREAGLAVREDAVSNLIGRLGSSTRGAKTLLLGSHLDTVRNAGIFDGPLGVFTAVAAVENAARRGIRFPFHIEVIGFCEEEGVRYQAPYIGSRAVAGTLRASDLKLTDEAGITAGEALRKAGFAPGGFAKAGRLRRDILGYMEVHIEQGPVLEAEGMGLGVVEAICGQTRARVRFEGMAGHAGTTPMRLRRDALSGAAEWIGAVEGYARGKRSLVATVGQAQVRPGAGNVIPGEVILSLDVRDGSDQARTKACEFLFGEAARIARRRGLNVSTHKISVSETVRCDKGLTMNLRRAARRGQASVPVMTSGAGHDAVAMAELCPVAMLFVRCKGGISHHPAESVRLDDIAAAVGAVTECLCDLGQNLRRRKETA